MITDQVRPQVQAPPPPPNAMMLGFVGSDGKTFPPIWIDGSVNATTYKNDLVHQVLLVLEATYGSNGYIWTQDGVPVHTSKAIQNYLENKLGLSGYKSNKMCPPLIAEPEPP